MRWMWLAIVLLGWPVVPAIADTCLSQSSTPTFQAGQSVPKVCDTHGSLRIVVVTAAGAFASANQESLMLARQLQEKQAEVARLRDAVASLEKEREELAQYAEAMALSNQIQRASWRHP